MRDSDSGWCLAHSSTSSGRVQFFLRQYSLHSRYSWEVSPQEAWLSPAQPTNTAANRQPIRAEDILLE